MTSLSRLEERAINTIRFLSADAVQKANSGHPGMPMGAATLAYTLWTRYLRFNPRNPDWPDRDRFVLSAGHGSMLLYSLLYLTGYDLSLDEIQRFRQWGSKTPGHPERGVTPGVEVTTGPLGQGFANAVGLALAEAHLASLFNRPGHTVVDHRTWVLASDGDLMEGISSEAASIAGHLGLGKLTVLYDANEISIDGRTDITFTEDVESRFSAQGWHTVRVTDGNDIELIRRAIDSALRDPRPSLILCRTCIGYGLPNKQNTEECHGSPPGVDELTAAKNHLRWPTEPWFFVPDDVLEHFRQAVSRGERLEADWRERFREYAESYPDLADELTRRFSARLPRGWDENLPTYTAVRLYTCAGA
ncbi:MAG: hypothetical protein QXS20_09905 [Candidatus Thorarchaeota archaeon]